LNGIFLKGVGIRVLWAQFGMLAAYAFIVFIAASRKMRLKVA